MSENNKIESSINNGLKQASIFKDNSFFYLYNKAEKIATALYMITNFMSVNEPLKWQIRENSLKFLDSIMSLNKISLSHRSLSMMEVNSFLFQLKALFGIAFRSGFISNMNYEIVDRELSGLVGFLSEYDANKLSIESPLFNKTFFAEPEPKGHVAEKSFVLKSNQNDMVRPVKDRDYKGQEVRSKITSPSEGMTERRNKIISIIKDKKEVTIKDIATAVSGVSEKTLQRELLAMVSIGLIRKEGERRWSRYSLK